jgi:hypothetical protein
MSCLSCRLFGGHNSVEADFAHLARVVARIFHTGEPYYMLQLYSTASVALSTSASVHNCSHGTAECYVLPSSSDAVVVVV